MQKILLSIGSNTYSKRNIRKAQRMLAAVFPTIRFTPSIVSKPYGNDYKRDFLNMLATFESDWEISAIDNALKNIEIKMGRLPEDKSKGRVIIDIDLLQAGEKVLKQKDFARCYVRELIGWVEYLT